MTGLSAAHASPPGTDPSSPASSGLGHTHSGARSGASRGGALPAPRPRGSTDGQAPVADIGLTPREREVLAALVAGRTNGEIARALFISVKTASVHVSNILRKLDVPNREQAARLGYRLGLAEGGHGTEDLG